MLKTVKEALAYCLCLCLCLRAELCASCGARAAKFAEPLREEGLAKTFGEKRGKRGFSTEIQRVHFCRYRTGLNSSFKLTAIWICISLTAIKIAHRGC